MKPLALFAAPLLLACSSLLSAAPAVDQLRLSVIPTASSSGAAEAMVVSGGRWGTQRHLLHAAVLIEHPQGRFLFDTGLGHETAEAFARNNWLNRTLLAYENLNPARDQLEAAGYQASDIDFILPSHLHWDHLGGLPDFPGLPVLILPGALEEAKTHGEPPAWDAFGDASHLIVLDPTAREKARSEAAPAPIMCGFCQEVTGCGAGEAQEVCAGVLEGAEPMQVASALMLMRRNGETPAEVAGFVAAMKAACVPVAVEGNMLDIVGTGGDGNGRSAPARGAARAPPPP